MGIRLITSSDRKYCLLFQLHSAEYFYDGEVHIILLSGSIYAKKPMEKILNKEIVATLEEFANSFNKLHLNDLEVSILCAVRLTCSGEYMYSRCSKIQIFFLLHSPKNCWLSRLEFTKCLSE